ncbi:MAG: hypothetical protein ACOX8R_09600 [Bacillota bacterium]
MKKLLSLMFAGSLLLAFCACGSEPAGDTADTAEPVPAVETAPEESGTVETPAAESDAALSLSDADALFEKARAVYDLFDLNPLATDPTVTAEIDGLDGYEKVSDASASSLAELRAKAEEVFTADLAAELLNNGRYAEKDGVLYERAADRGADITRGKILSTELTDVTDSGAVYTVTVENIDFETEQVSGTQKVTYRLAKSGGAWRFSEFEALY